MLLHLQNIKDSSEGTDKIWCFYSNRPEKMLLQPESTTDASAPAEYKFLLQAQTISGASIATDQR
jgi:hypothetical protein